MPGCYGAVLTPYNKVRVDAGATPYSGDYLITKVVHRITPSLYSQELEAKTDSATEVSGAQVAEALGGASSGDLLMADVMERTVERLVERVGSSYFGKYRGIVTDVDDPQNQCRIRATVPAVLGEHACGWAMPAMPFAGAGHGVVMLPEIGSGVWIEFEAGRPRQPHLVGRAGGPAASGPIRRATGCA